MVVNEKTLLIYFRSLYWIKLVSVTNQRSCKYGIFIICFSFGNIRRFFSKPLTLCQQILIKSLVEVAGKITNVNSSTFHRTFIYSDNMTSLRNLRKWRNLNNTIIFVSLQYGIISKKYFYFLTISLILFTNRILINFYWTFVFTSCSIFNAAASIWVLWI